MNSLKWFNNTKKKGPYHGVVQKKRSKANTSISKRIG